MYAANHTLKGGGVDNKRPGGDIKRPGGEMHVPDAPATTKSQLLPIGRIGDLPKKPFFIPGIVVVIAVFLLFQFANPSSTFQVMYAGVLPVNVPTYSLVLAFMLTAGFAYAFYRMIGKKYAWWVMPTVVVVMGFVTESSAMAFFHAIFQSGSFETAKGDLLPTAFFKMVFRAGLPEEFLKAIPIAIGVWIALKLKDQNSPLAQFRVAEPLDGIMIGVASGLGFAFAETLLTYVPRIILGGDANAVLIFKAYKLLAAKIGEAHAIIEIQKLMPGREQSLQVLIPRVLGNICGHACYSGILGYYVGLAVLKPVNRVKTVLIGLAIAVGIHAAWDSVGFGFLLALVAFAGFAILSAAIVKGREISPNRGQLMASQLLDRFSRIHSAPVPAAAAAAPAAPAPFAPAAPAASPRAADAPAPSMTWDDASNLLVIEIGTARVPAVPGAHLYARQAPGALPMNDDGVVGEVNANPNDPAVLGIKNLSKQTWEVTTEPGERRELVPGRTVRLARNTRILIGDLYAVVK